MLFLNFLQNSLYLCKISHSDLQNRTELRTGRKNIKDENTRTNAPGNTAPFGKQPGNNIHLSANKPN